MFASKTLLLCSGLLVMMTVQSVVGQTISLSPYAIEPGSLTVSGISAGGAMATQFHVAFSSKVSGVGIFAGIPYGCAKGSLLGATNCMSSPILTNVNTLISRADGYASKGTIDPTSNMANDKVYIFAGKSDTVVSPTNGNQIETFYQHYIQTASNFLTEFTLKAQHCQPTDNFGTACATLNSANYINNCNYNGAYEMLNFVYNNKLRPPVTAVMANLFKFDQKEFFNLNRPSSASMDDIGFVYIPTECKDPTRLCKLHIALHGCQQGFYKISDTFVKNTQYLEVAEANAIIVVFPQVVSTAVSNPNGCFDWWGYNDANYETKNGAQMAAIMNMAKKLGLP